MPDTIVKNNTKGDMSPNFDLRDFCSILKYELDIPNDLNTIMNTIEYLERRGFKIYRNHNI